MTFKDISYRTVQALNANLKLEDVVPGSYPPSRGAAAQSFQDDFHLSDEFIRVLPFRSLEQDSQPFSRQYSAQTLDQGPLTETDQITARTVAASPDRDTGNTISFGVELETFGTYFKRISATVRTDTSMTGASPDVLDTMVNLARVSIVRSLSEALFVSVPVNDEEDAGLAGFQWFLANAPTQDMLYDPNRTLLAQTKELIIRCRPGADGLGERPDALVTCSQIIMMIVDAQEKLGVTPDYQFCPLTGQIQPHYCGIPLLEGRVPQPEGEPISEIYALRLTGRNAIELLTLGGDEYGIHVENRVTMAGMNASHEATNVSLGTEIFGVYALSVKDWRSISRLRSVPIDLQ